MKLKLFTNSCVCAVIVLLAGCQTTTTQIQESDVPEQEITTISQLDEAPSGVANSLVADPNEKSFFSRVMGTKSAPSTTSPALLEKTSVKQGPAPLGVPVKACGVSKKAMGTKIDGYPAKRPKVVLYDSNPNNKAPHDFYITGFSDKCPRKFTAAVAMFGDLELHEIMRYEVKPKSVPYSETEMAYEVLKNQKCNVKKGVACGEKKMKSLSRSTALVTLYGAFGDAGDWAEVLLHNGKVRASNLVTRR